jgi:plastocyanin
MHRGRALWGASIMIGLFVVFAGIGLYEASTHRGTAPTAHSFEVDVVGSKMSPSRLEVREGDQVVLKLTSDGNHTLTLKGYNQQFTLTNSAPISATFVADQRGAFDFVLDNGTKIGQLVVT